MARTARPITGREVTSDILLTFAAIVLLFIGWQQWWTNVQADEAYVGERDSLLQQWGAADGNDGVPGPSRSTPSSGASRVSHRKVVVEGLLYIPRLRSHVWGTPIIRGTTMYDLAHGVGRYKGSARYGEIGNTAIAGHRTTHGRPFRHLDSLRKGDVVVVRTKDSWFVYSLDRMKIVKPSDTWVAGPIPYDNAPARLLTLTTCNPVHSAKQRLVWWGHLKRTQSDASAPIELGKG